MLASGRAEKTAHTKDCYCTERSDNHYRAFGKISRYGANLWLTLLNAAAPPVFKFNPFPD